jgi:phosphonate transport system substrate-binding protein
MRRSFAVVLAVVFVLSLLSVPAAWAKDKLVMGVHPYKPISDLYKIYKPIADAVAQKMGKPVELRIGKTYDEAVELVGKGDVDFSYLGPSLYVEAKSKFNVKLLAQIITNGKPVFHGVIIAKKGSGIAALKDLKGKNFAFGERESTLSHIVPLYMLMEAGVQLSDLKKYGFFGTHDNVALNVLRGASDAAGVQPDVADKYLDQGLQIIARSEDLPEHVFAATKSLDPATTTKLQNALLGLDMVLLKGIKAPITGIQKGNDKDFDVLRKIMKAVEKEKNK